MSQPLKLRSLHLRNWKNFEKVDVVVQDRAFLVGPNASGKSNLLDALCFLRDLATPGGGLLESIAGRGGVDSIRSLTASRDSDVEVGITLESQDGSVEWKYQIIFNQTETEGLPYVRLENIVEKLINRDSKCSKKMNKNKDGFRAKRPDSKDKRNPIRLTQTFLEQVNENYQFRDLVNFLTSISRLHIVPQVVREPERWIRDSNDPFGGDFLERVAKTRKSTRQARLKRIQKALTGAVPQLKEIELWRDPKGVLHLRGRYQHWRGQGAWQTEEQFSDGTLRLIGLLWVVLEEGGLLLLEEPEQSLHSEIVRMLPQMLARAQHRTGKQVFLTTHSPELLYDEGIGLDEVLLLTPEAEGTKVSLAASHSDVRNLLECGFNLVDAIIPKTKPDNVFQITLLDNRVKSA